MSTAPLLHYLEPDVINRVHDLFPGNAAKITDIQHTFNLTEVSGNRLGSQGDLCHPHVAMHISSDGVLRAFIGHCSCPYGINCKHTAALYLTYMAGAQYPCQMPGTLPLIHVATPMSSGSSSIPTRAAEITRMVLL